METQLHNPTATLPTQTEVAHPGCSTRHDRRSTHHPNMSLTSTHNWSLAAAVTPRSVQGGLTGFGVQRGIQGAVQGPAKGTVLIQMPKETER
mmetsp:Transcript_11777/g.21356  ORF Transcript_11777/g.21356 Transcript_11777/m.21356 type:complete len:92 (-) Transcript_11777:558-833(-)